MNLLSAYCAHLIFVYLENNAYELGKLEEIKRRAAFELDFEG